MKLRPRASGIKAIMEKYKWNRTQFAQFLCIDRRTVDKMLEEKPVSAIILLYIQKEFNKNPQEISY
jgi:plasmid maintenance system antidote protein VapI